MAAPVADLGYVAVGSTIRIPWDSVDPTGAPITASGFAASDLQIYKDGGTTQRASANGITATTDFDGLTGLHLIAIDLSDDSDAGFYAAGSEYLVAVSTVDVNSVTVRFWVARFVIGVQPANVTQFGGSSGTFSSGRPEVNATHWGGT